VDVVTLGWGLSFRDHADVMVTDDGRQRNFIFDSVNEAHCGISTHLKI
jgi:hypothetical protein